MMIYLAALDTTQIIVAMLGSGTLLAALISVVTKRVEKDSIVVASAENVVKMLSAEVARLSAQVAQIDTLKEKVDKLEGALVDAQRERDRVKAENEQLIERVQHLERKVETLEENGDG